MNASNERELRHRGVSEAPKEEKTIAVTPPPHHAEPPKIDLWYALNCRLDKIDPVEQTFAVNGWLNFFWIDKELDTRPEVTLEKKTVKIEDNGENQPINVNAMFENAVAYALIGDPVFRWNPKNGVVSETIHFKATLSEEMELERFPFDRQYLTLRICIRTKEFRCLSEPPDHVPNRLNMRTMAVYTCSPSIAGWSSMPPVVGFCKAAGQSDDLRITVSLRVERQYSYWLYNIVLAIFLIVGLAPIAFCIPPDAISDRMGVILTLLLTLVTFKFIIASETPKTSTITLLDKYILLGYFMLLLVVIQTMVLLLFPEEKWISINRNSALSMLGFWLAFHLWIIKAAFVRDFSIPWEQMKDEGASVEQPTMMVSSEHITLPAPTH